MPSIAAAPFVTSRRPLGGREHTGAAPEPGRTANARAAEEGTKTRASSGHNEGMGEVRQSLMTHRRMKNVAYSTEFATAANLTFGTGDIII